MELKCCFARYLKHFHSFYQSYHRGIEINERHRDNPWRKSINRTIVELKYLSEDVVVVGQYYQSYHRGIEIKSNTLPTSTTILSIVPSWNWNKTSGPPPAKPLTINRTIVELKLGRPYSIPWSRPPINRTIVELKFAQFFFVRVKVALSIVPSWNWNLRKTGLERPPDAINRTIVELKWRTKQPKKTLLLTINRTIVELKFHTFPGSLACLPLSIVPSWNWNGVCL